MEPVLKLAPPPLGSSPLHFFDALPFSFLQACTMYIHSCGFVIDWLIEQQEEREQ